jgi:serine/threonine protein kinase
MNALNDDKMVGYFEASFLECCLMNEPDKRLSIDLLAQHALISDSEFIREMEKYYGSKLQTCSFNGIKKKISKLNIAKGGFGKIVFICKPKKIHSDPGVQTNETKYFPSKIMPYYAKKVSKLSCKYSPIHTKQKPTLCDECKKYAYNVNEFNICDFLNKKSTPNIPAYYKNKVKTVTGTATKVTILMELIPSYTLDDLLKVNNCLLEADARKIFRQISKTISVMHSNKYIHRDIKPKNILIRTIHNKYKAYLIDFGISKYDTGNTQFGPSSFDSPQMIAPIPSETQPKYSIDFDIWSLGALLYKMLYGNDIIVLTYEDTPQSFFDNNPQIFPINQNVSYAALNLILKCLKYDTKKRITIERIIMSKFYRRKSHENHIFIKDQLKICLTQDTTEKMNKDIEYFGNELESIDCANQLFNSLC